MKRLAYRVNKTEENDIIQETKPVWENSSWGLIDAVHQRKLKMPHHWRPPSAWTELYFSNVYNIQSMIPEDQKNITTQWWSTGRHCTAATQVQAQTSVNSLSNNLLNMITFDWNQDHTTRQTLIFFFFNAYINMFCLLISLVKLSVKTSVSWQRFTKLLTNVSNKCRVHTYYTYPHNIKST